MKSVRKMLPFVAAFVVLVGSVLIARAVHARPSDVYPVNTGPNQNGIVYTVRVFKDISSVVVIDSEKHARRKHLAPGSYSYDPQTTRLDFAEPLPFADPVVHVEGTAVQPEQFYIPDFSGAENELLVLFKDRVAIAGFEYVYDADTHLITFRSDLHPEADGNFHITFQTADGAGQHGFGSWRKKDLDALSELEWQWMHQTQGAPLHVMKLRTGVSDRKLTKEVGFSVRLPKGDSTFLTETMEDMEKHVSVMRWYNAVDAVIECKATPFAEIGADDTETSFVRTWERDGTFYQLSTSAENRAAAEKLLSSVR